MSKPFDAKNQETYNFIFFYENELVKQFKNIDKSGDGQISFDEFSQLMNSFGYILANEELQADFAKYDTDRDQKISVNEYIAYVKKCNEFNKLKEEYTNMFKSIDVNGNGFINSSELKAHWEGLGVDLNDSFYSVIVRYFDLDTDKQINLEEYLDILTFKHLKSNVSTIGNERPKPGYYFDKKNQETYEFIFYYENELAKMFRKIDKDNSGSITFNEFAEQMKSFGFEISLDELKMRFGEQDENKDSKISLDEYIKYTRKCDSFNKLKEEYTNMFKSIDVNGNGFINSSELKAHWEGLGVDLNDSFYPTIVQYFDLNTDRQINLDEYLDILTFKHLKSTN